MAAGLGLAFIFPLSRIFGAQHLSPSAHEQYGRVSLARRASGEMKESSPDRRDAAAIHHMTATRGYRPIAAHATRKDAWQDRRSDRASGSTDRG
jgi:hypothetical protein